MRTLTINIKNSETYEKINWLLKKLKDDVEIISEEDLGDLILLAETRGEESVPFEEFLKNEDKGKFILSC